MNNIENLISYHKEVTKTKVDIINGSELSAEYKNICWVFVKK